MKLLKLIIAVIIGIIFFYGAFQALIGFGALIFDDLTGGHAGFDWYWS